MKDGWVIIFVHETGPAFMTDDDENPAVFDSTEEAKTALEGHLNESRARFLLHVGHGLIQHI